MTERKIWDEINAVATLPGITPASPLHPIEGRVVMLQSGIRASMAIRIYGDNLAKLAKASLAVRDHLRRLPQVRGDTVNPDIVLGQPYIEFQVDREAAARYGMSVASVNEVVEAALGGMDIKVETQAGVVSLFGFVRSLDDVARVEGIARAVSGVTAIRNHLRVANRPSQA